ncbi:hypothetical protein OG933_17955 [Streptomyces sp. NBC_00016]|uniref:hypothetical protein n=1 Tax=Streptomyces sp. NBC_00016 TaxID=2975622 RepID=UPI0032443AE7
MTYNPTSYEPERFNDIPDMAFNRAPANQGHISELERRNRLLEAKVEYLSDPTKRKDYVCPELPSAYFDHPTDDSGVIEAGAKLNKTLDYVSKQIDSHTVQMVEFNAAVTSLRKAESDYQKALTQSIEDGKEAPDFETEDLSPRHRALDKLEAVISAGVRKAEIEAAILQDEYSRLFASQAYRAWADKERDKRWADYRKAVDLVNTALSAIESINSKLPHAFGDEYGIPFEAPAERVYGGLNGFAEQQDYKPTIREAVSILQEHEPKAYRLSQLDEDDKAHYALRSAEAKIEREDSRTSEEKWQDADNANYSHYIASGGILK